MWSITRPPRIVSQLTGGGTYNEGANVSLSVFAEGAVPLTYHWLKDGGPAPGANINSATYSILGVLPSDAGNYSVIVSNSI